MFYGASNPEIAVKEVGRKREIILLPSENFIRIKESGYLICLRFKAGKTRYIQPASRDIEKKRKLFVFAAIY